MSYREIPLFIDCEGASLLGVLAAPESPAGVGVVIVVGGPQYRVGSHRQFVLLARELAAAGIACLRFDYRGMGDSDGPKVGFEEIDADIRAAIDTLCREVDTVRTIVLWGLCDGATAAAFYSAADDRVCGLALFNPWVRTPASEAQTIVKHYYLGRVLSRAFWRKLFAGKVDVTDSVASFWRNLRGAISRSRLAPDHDGRIEPTAPLPDRIAVALLTRPRPILLGLSGKDSVAAEFSVVASRPGPLAMLVSRANAVRTDFPDSDHTFSSAQWRDRAARATLDWLRGHFAIPGGAARDAAANPMERMQ